MARLRYFASFASFFCFFFAIAAIIAITIVIHGLLHPAALRRHK
jgi:hypothetical protein